MIDNSMANIHEEVLPCPCCSGDKKFMFNSLGELIEFCEANQDYIWGVDTMITMFNEWKQSRLVNCPHCEGAGFITLRR